MSYLLGIDLGGSSVKGAAVTRDGQALAREQADFDVERPLDWAEKVRSLIASLQAARGGVAERIGLSAPGLISRSGRAVAHMPGRLHGLEGLNWTEFLNSRQVVPVLNDAQAALLGEAWLGAARGLTNVILLTLGTGVGGAAMVDGHLLRGHLGRAGHLGHISLDPEGKPDLVRTPGSLELAIGNGTIRERSGGRFTTTHALIAAHLAGDTAATEIWMRSIRLLACGLASLINVLDPEAVVIGGGIARAEAALFAPLQRHLDLVEWRPGGQRVKLVPAQLGEFAGAIGAARHALLAAVD